MHSTLSWGLTRAQPTTEQQVAIDAGKIVPAVDQEPDHNLAQGDIRGDASDIAAIN
jgi:hypothetical protein